MISADDGKRSKVVSAKVTERMEVDLLRLAAMEDRSVSEFMYLLVRRELYGNIVRLNDDAGQSER